MGKQYKIETFCYGDIQKSTDNPNKIVYLNSDNIDITRISIPSENESESIKNIIDLAIQDYPGTKFKINSIQLRRV